MALCTALGAGAAPADDPPAPQPGCLVDPAPPPQTDLCRLFEVRLAATGDAAASRLTLVVLRTSDRGLMARIDRGETRGQPVALRRADAPLDRAAVSDFLDRLIAEALAP